MRTIVSSLVITAFVAAMAIPASAENGRNGTRNGLSGERQDCVVTGWTDWSNTRPIFKCPENEVPAKNGRRR